jgi:hypothetical protein
MRCARRRRADKGWKLVRLGEPLADDDRDVIHLFLVVRELTYCGVNTLHDLSCGVQAMLSDDFEESSGAELFPIR